MAAALRKRARGILWLAWFVVLLLPSAIGFVAWDPWTCYASAAFFVAVWLAVGSRWFFVVTYPLALFGLLAFAADLLRGVDLLDLWMVQGRVDWREAYFALRPYFAAIGAAVFALALGAIAGFRRPVPSPSARARTGGLALLLGGIGVMSAASHGMVMRAWPLNVASVEAATVLGRNDWIAVALPWASVSPRRPKSSWSASRRQVPASKPETYILVIGESVRADRLAACGGPSALSINLDAIVYCNVTSGASSTYLSVPLLVSREMPGAPERVSTDATVARAFEESGFRTYWIAAQERRIAWPDADVMRFITRHSASHADLLPPLRSALDDPAAKKKFLVIHTYGAHFPYCHRFDPKTAPIAVDCAALGPAPTPATLRNWIAAYDDAVAETLRFLNALIERLDASGEEAFLAYTPDHGENLLDDERGLYYHALSEPTRFDTRVPIIFWASPAWRRNHPAKFQALEAHRGVAAMHADLVPTLLGAADISYSEPRKKVVDLTRAAPPPRTRWVARRLGMAVDGDRLR